MKVTGQIGAWLVLGLFGWQLAIAEEPKRELLVDFVSPALLGQTNQHFVNQQDILVSHSTSNTKNADTLLVEHPPPTSTSRWRAFEAEFGIHQREPAPFMASLQLTKYEVDRVIFWADELSRTVARALEFDYRVARLTELGEDVDAPFRQARSNPLLRAFEDVRLKSAINLSFVAPPTLALKLELPFGN